MLRLLLLRKDAVQHVPAGLSGGGQRPAGCMLVVFDFLAVSDVVMASAFNLTCLGCCLQDFEEVASASLAVFEVTELMADECPDAEAVGAEQLTSLAAQLAAAHERLQELLAQAQQEANNEGEGEQDQ